MNKQGQVSMEFIVKSVTILFCLIFISILIQRTFSNANDNIVEKTCRESVDLRANTATNIEFDGAGLKGVKFSPLLCKTQDIKLLGTKDEVKKDLADLMANCWYMFREGRTNDVFSSVPGIGGANKGFVCYTALIEEVKLENGDTDTRIPVQEMLDYLVAQESYPKMKEGDRSYLSYIQYGGGPGRIMFYLQNDVTIPKYTQGFIDQGHGYEIAYIEKRGNENDWIDDVLISGGGALVGLGVAFAAPTGGFSLVMVGAATAATGLLAAGAGGVIAYDELNKERDVSTIMVLDFADKQKRREFHQNVFIGDIAGE